MVQPSKRSLVGLLCVINFRSLQFLFMGMLAMPKKSNSARSKVSLAIQSVCFLSPCVNSVIR